MNSTRPALARGPIGLALAGAFGIATAIGIGRFVYTPILPAMMTGLSLDPAQAGLIASANFIGYLAGAIVASLPSLPGSRQRWLAGSLLVSLGTTALSGVGDTLPVLMAVRMVAGVASAFALIFICAIVLDRLSLERRTGLSALLFAGPGIGITTSSVVVSAMSAAGFGWRALWFGSAAMGVAAIAAAWRLGLFTQPPASSQPGTGRATLRRSGRSGALFRIILSYGLFGFGYVITATFLVALTRDNPDLRSVEPWMWPIVGITAAPSVVIWNALGRRIGASRAYGVSCLLEAVGIAASVLWLTPTGLVVAAALLGFTFVSGTALGLIIANHMASEDSRRMVGVMTSALGVGQILGPIFAGYLHTASGSYLLPSLAAALVMVVAGALAFSTQER